MRETPIQLLDKIDNDLIARAAANPQAVAFLEQSTPAQREEFKRTAYDIYRDMPEYQVVLQPESRSVVRATGPFGLMPEKMTVKIPAKTRRLRDREMEILWAKIKDDYNRTGKQTLVEELDPKQADELYKIGQEEGLTDVFGKREGPEGWVQNVVGRAGRSLAKVPGQMLEGVGQLMSAQKNAQDFVFDNTVGRVFPSLKEGREEVSDLFDFGQRLVETGKAQQDWVDRDLYPEAPGSMVQPGRNPDIASQVADSVGSVAGSFIGGGARKAGALAASAAMIAQQGAEDARQSLEGSDLSDEEKARMEAKAAAYNLPAAALDVLPIGRLLNRYGLGRAARSGAGQGLVRTAGEILKEGAVQGTFEGLTESGQQVWTNAMANFLYDPERKLTQGALDAALVGAIMGGGMGGLASTGQAAIDHVQMRSDRKRVGRIIAQLDKVARNSDEEKRLMGELYEIAHRYNPDLERKLLDSINEELTKGAQETNAAPAPEAATARPEADGKALADANKANEAAQWQKIKNAFRKLIRGKIQQDISFLNIDKRTSDEISRLTNGAIDVSNCSHALTYNFIGHLKNEKRFNAEEQLKDGNLPLTLEDITRIPSVLKNWDKIEVRQKQKRKNPAASTIKYSKQFDDGTIIYIEEVWNGKGRKDNPVLASKTMYKKGRDQQVNDAKSPVRYAQSVLSPYRNTTNTPQHPQSQAGMALPLTEPSAAQGPNQTPSASRTAEPAQGYAFPKNATPRPVYSDTPVPKAKVPSIGDLRRYYSEALGIPIRKGFNVSVRGAEGYYRPDKETIHAGKGYYNDLRVIAHEMGHAIVSLLMPTHADRAPHRNREGALRQEWQFYDRPDIRTELRAKCEATFGKNTYPVSQQVGEGMAEYFYMRHVDPARAARECPKFDAYFNELLEKNPGVKKIVDNGVAMAQAYLNASPLGRVQSAIFRGNFARGFERMMHEKRVKLKEWLVDRNAFVLDAEEQLKKYGLKEAEAKMEEVYSHLRGADGRFHAAMLFENSDLSGNRVGQGLRDILDSIGNENISAFESYLVAKRAIELARTNHERALPIDLADAKAVVAQYEEQFKKAARDLYAFQNQNLRLLVEGGLLSREEYRRIVSKSKFYVPFYRNMEDIVASENDNAARMAAKRLRRMSPEGSERELKGVLESIVQNAYNFRTAAEKNLAILQFVKEAESTQGGGRIAEKAVPQFKVVHITERHLKKELARNEFVKDVAEKLESTPEEVVSNILEKSPELKTLFLRRAMNDPHKGIFTVFENGKMRAYQTNDANLYNALLEMNRVSAKWRNSIPARVLSFPTKTVRAGATLVDQFMLRNFLRDIWVAAVYNKNTKKYLKNLPRAARAAFTKNSDYKEFVRRGGAMSSRVALDVDTIEKVLDELEVKRRTFAGKTAYFANPLNWPKTFLRALQALSESFENTTRIATYLASVESGMTPAQAAAAARSNTVDFKRAGVAGEFLNGYMPFLNASLQGLDKHYRSIMKPILTGKGDVKGAWKAFISFATYFSGLSLLNWYLGKDDEDIQNLPDEQKFLNWNIKIGDTIFSAPKPQEIGWIFGSGLEMLLDAWYKKDPEAVEIWIKSMMENLNVFSLPTFMKVPVETATNYSFFRQAPIENAALQRLPVELRASPTTTHFASDFSSLIGGAGGLSPAKIDNAVYGLSGGLGRQLTKGYDYGMELLGLRPERPADTLNNLPFVGAIVQSQYAAPRTSKLFYENAQMAEEVIAAENAASKRANGRMTDYVADNNEKVQWAHFAVKRYRKTQQILSEINRQIQILSNDPNLTGRQKQPAMMEWIERRNRILNEAQKLSYKNWLKERAAEIDAPSPDR